MASRTAHQPPILPIKSAASALPRRVRRVVIRASSRSYLRRLRRRFLTVPNLAFLTAALSFFAVALWQFPFVPSGPSAYTDAVSRRAAPLTPGAFQAIAQLLANRTSRFTRRLSDPALITGSVAIWGTRSHAAAIPEAEWDAIADDVAIAIKTGHEVAHRRLNALKSRGWLSVGRRVPNVLVVADAAIPSLGVIDVKRYALDIVVGALRNRSNPTHPLPNRWFERSGWKGDKDKNLPTLHLLRSTFPRAKWYILLDDDTHLFLDNFARYAARTPDDSPVYTGKVFYISSCGGFLRNGAPGPTSTSKRRGLFAHGGAGIFVNKAAMDAVYGNIGNCVREFSSCWAGDMQVGLCMHNAGVQVHNFKNGHSHEYMFTPFWPSRAMADSRYTRRLRSALEPVTFHKIPPREASLVAEFERKCARNGSIVQYGTLRQYLQDNGIQPVFGWRPTKYDTHVFFRVPT